MRSGRIRLARGLAWSWMAMACAACVPWWCGCGTAMRLAFAGNGPVRDFLPALPKRLSGVPGSVTGAGCDQRAGSRAAVISGFCWRGYCCSASAAGNGYPLPCQCAG